MSRGGSRGRGGRGGGGDRGMPPGGFGSLSRQEWTEAMQKMKTLPKYSGMLYPPLDNASTSYLAAPNEHESLIMSHSISLNSSLSTGKGAPTTASSSSSSAAAGGQIGENGQAAVPAGGLPPWRISGERKVVGIEIESYSDRFNPPSLSSGPSKLDSKLLKLDPGMFPPSLWVEYFEGNAKEKAKARPKKRRKLDDMDKDDNDAEEDEGTPPPSSDEDFDFDEDEEDDHGDYDANYFDNGEGDDDSGGDEDEGGGGGYDD
ncbi:hypothetical protein I316_04428 [Kwoniella heveanensis BCC8398]|uniref:DNA-directed RNA polymerase III subunit n=1 Tax=Kwoniella heveanensis BCC8398 TaxID=1296120 RepID=A0A1B9GRR8_9TREE|nr:hypothetical protein I316_04428 [Kwoniella heveanensis BCC8398]